MNPRKRSVQESIEAFLSSGFEKYKEGSNVIEYLGKFNQLFVECFDTREFLFLKQDFPLFNSYFRFRPIKQIKNFNDAGEYSYPKNPSKIQRANLPGFPVFYCSQHPSVAINEMKRHNDNESLFVVSKWTKAISSSQFIHVPTFASQPEFRESLYRIIETNFKVPDEEKRGMADFFEFFGNELVKNDDYSISACLAHKYLQESDVEALTFPSVADFKGVNVAFSKSVIDQRKLVLDIVYEVELLPENQLRLYSIRKFQKDICTNYFNTDQVKRDERLYKTFIADFGTP